MTSPVPAASQATGDEIVIGMDIGTTNSKGVACRVDGTVVAQVRLEHQVSSPHRGWVEHDADAVWWADVVTICRRLLKEVGSGQAATVRALAVTTCGPCLVPVDAAARPLRAGILYGVDTRASDQIASLQDRIGRRAILGLSRMPLTSQAVGPKIAWIAEYEPDVFRRTTTFHTATSYVVRRLTGVDVIDHHQASYFTPFIDARRRTWDVRHAPELDLARRLPPIRWPGQIAGTVTGAAASETGLAAGTPVLVGTSDGPAEAVAVGALRPGIVAATYGSTTTLTTFGRRPGRSAGLWVSDGITPDAECLAAGLSTSGSILAWFRREFAVDLPAADAAGRARAMAILVDEAATSPAGANGLLVLPYLSGERTPFADPLARGTVVGLTLAHTRADLARAILEGIAFALRHIADTFTGAGIPVGLLRSAGGGAIHPLGLQIVSDVTGLTQEIPVQTIGAAYGAAFLAAGAVGLAPAPDAGTDGWFRVSSIVRPDPANSAVYAERYDLFRRLYRDTRVVNHALARGAVVARSAPGVRP